jgi:hypothetical protein
MSSSLKRKPYVVINLTYDLRLHARWGGGPRHLMGRTTALRKLRRAARRQLNFDVLVSGRDMLALRKLARNG